MPNQRATLFFEFGQHGWTESYVRTADSPLIASAAAEDLLKARRKVMAYNVTLNDVRISDVSIFRDSVFNQVPKGSAKDYQLEKCTEPWNCLLVRLESGATYRKNVFMRGVPDVWMDPDRGLRELDPGYAKQVKDYLTFLKDNSWGFMVRNVAPAANGKVIDVDVITQAPKVIVKTQNAHTLADGDKVIIRGVKGTRGVNGVHEIKVTAAGGAQYFELLNVNDTRFYLGGGTWRKYDLVFAAINRGIFEKVSKRDTGRPSNGPRGRRLTRKP